MEISYWFYSNINEDFVPIVLAKNRSRREWFILITVKM